MAHCTEQNDLWGSNYAVAQSYADAYMICMLLDRGSVEEAEHALELIRDGFRIGEGVRLFAEAEAKVHFTRGRYAEALAALESVQDVMSTVHNPVWRPWRSMRAQVLARLGRRDEALALVEEELELARRWGTDTLVGKTMRVLGELRGEEGLPLLREAVARLRNSPRRLELAQALRALGTLLSGRDDAAAREALDEALELAERCGAYSLRERVAGLLRELGVEVPTEPRSRQAFTASERRIVELAVAGVPYPDIAQSLFATTSTVTTIVEAVCSRLGAGDLDELREALDRHRAV
jgi:DNA-binding NarL/FixJ family response regulator